MTDIPINPPNDSVPPSPPPSPPSSPPPGGGPEQPPGGEAPRSSREKLVEAFMTLLKERRFERIGLKDIAERADVPLAEFRGEFYATFEIIAAYVKDLDRKVLAEATPDDVDSTVRERLFDVLMRRFELMTPYRRAFDNLRYSAMAMPSLGMGLNMLSVRSMHWMLAAAGIPATGMRGALRAQALAVLFARVAETWLNDDDPGLSRTMARLDRDLSRAASWSNRFDDVCRMMPSPRCPPVFGCGSTRRHRSHRTGEDAAPAAAI